MPITLTRGQIAAANRLFDKINKAAQYEATAEEIRAAKVGQKIVAIRRKDGSYKKGK